MVVHRRTSRMTIFILTVQSGSVRLVEVIKRVCERVISVPLRVAINSGTNRTEQSKDTSYRVGIFRSTFHVFVVDTASRQVPRFVKNVPSSCTLGRYETRDHDSHSQDKAELFRFWRTSVYQTDLRKLWNRILFGKSPQRGIPHILYKCTNVHFRHHVLSAE